MAISTDQKVDYLWKKVGYGAAKRDVRTVLDATNESVPSPLLLRGDNVLAQSNLIPSIIPNSDSGVVGVHTIGNPLEISSFDNNASDNRSWNTGITDWISPEFGSTYVVKVYVHNSGDPSNAAVLSNQLFGAGSNNDDEWFFDYQAGTLNFIGENLPNGIDFSGKSVYVTGAYYSGIKGVAAPGSSVSFTNIDVTEGIDVTGIITTTYLNVTGISTLGGSLLDIDASLIEINSTIDHVGIITTRGLSIGVGTELVGISTILDEDNMISDSDTALATQQSIKKYVDDEVSSAFGSVSLGFTGDPGAESGTIDLDSQLLSIHGTANEIETASSGQTITIGLPNEVAITTSLTIGSVGIGTTSLTIGSVGIGTTSLTIGSVGIGTTSLTIGSIGITSIDSDISGVSTQHDTLASAKAIKDYVDSRELTFGANTTNGTTQVRLSNETFSILGETDQIITSGIGQQLTVGLRTDVTVVGNLEVGGNVSIGGSNTTLSSVTLTVIDRDLVLGFNTDQYQNDASTDDSANHGGIAIASTEGNPLVSIQASGIITSVVDPNITDNYKKFMWFKKDTFTGLSTDAWLSNYAIGVGATQFASGTRFAVGTPNNYVSSGITREGTVSIAGTDRITGINTVDIIRGFEISADETIIESGTFVTEVGIGSIGISKGSVGVGITDLTFGNRNRVAGIRMTDTDIDAFGKVTANNAIFSSDNATLGDDYSTLTVGERPAGDGYASVSFKNDTNGLSAKIDGTSSGLNIWGNKNSVDGERFSWNGGSSTEYISLKPRAQTVLYAQHDGSNGKVGINSILPISNLDLSGSAYITGGTFNASSLGAGNDSKNDAALVMNRSSAIYVQNDGYLKNVIGVAGTVINIGQQNTSHFTEINLRPGNADSNGVKLHHGGTTDNVKLQTTDSGVSVTGGISATGITTITSDLELTRGTIETGVTRKLVIGGARQSYSTGDFASLEFKNYDKNTSAIDYVATEIRSSLPSPARDGGVLQFLTTPFDSTTALERVRITDLGNIGIGTNDPIAVVDINPGYGTDYTGTFTGADARLPTTGEIRIGSGDVGVANTAAGDYVGLRLSVNSDSGDANAAIFAVREQGNGDASTSLTFATREWNGNFGSLTEKVRITSDGYFGIGITNPSERLDVNGNVVVSGFTSTSQLKVGVGTLGLVGISTILDEDNMISDSDTALATQQSIKKYVDDEIDTAFGSVSLAFGGDSNSSGTIDLDQQTLSIVGTNNEIVTSASNQQLQISLPDDVVIGQDLTVQRNLTVDGTITVGGTSATLFTETLNVADADLILGVRTDGNGVDSSTDTTANHGGIAIASTEGNPLVTLVNPGAGETLPRTYKKIMWFKKDSFAGLSTDAWISNYAIGIGTTQMATHEVLGVGGNTKIHGDLNISGKSVRGSVTGIGTTSDSVSIHTLPKATYRSVEYNIQATQGSKYQSTKVLSIHNGSDAFLTQYGTIHTDGSISNYGSDISSNDFRLLAIAEGATEAQPINYIVNFVATVV